MPHHICREMPSRDIIHPFEGTLSSTVGIGIFILPSLTAAIAGSASGFILTNHWGDRRGSTIVMAAIAVADRHDDEPRS